MARSGERMIDARTGELNRIGRRYNERVYHADPDATREAVDSVATILETDLPGDIPGRAATLLAQLLMIRHEQGDPRAAEWAVQALTRFETTYSNRDPRGRAGLGILRDCLLRRAELTGDLAVWRRAVRVARRLTAGGRGTADDWSMLAHLLAQEHARTRHAGPITEAVKITDCHIGEADSPTALTRYASVYGQHATFSCRREDFELSLATYRRAVAQLDEDDPNSAVVWSDIGAFLMNYCALYPLGTGINEAVAACTKALDLTSAEHLERPARCVNLAAVLMNHYEQTGDIQSLTTAASRYREALDLAPVNHPQHFVALSGRAGALLRIAELHYDEMAAREAIELAEEAVEATPLNHYHRSTRVNILATLLSRRAALLGRPEDLQQATELLHKTMVGLGQTDTRRAMFESNLGAIYENLYTATHNPDDLQRSIEANMRAIDSTPADHSERAIRLMNCAVTLTTAAVLSGSVEAHDRAITTAHAGILALTGGHPAAGAIHMALADALEAKYNLTRDESDAQRAMTAYRDALDVFDSVPARMRIAIGFGQFAAKLSHFGQALDGYTVAIASMDEAVARSLNRPDQERVLTMLAGVPQDAAALALHTGQPHLALELLEQGRGVIISRAIQASADRSHLETAHPDLAKELREVESSLLRAQRPTSGSVVGDDGVSWSVEDILSLQHRRSSLLDQIRELVGFERFERPATAGTIVDAVAHRTAVVINISQFRCDALILNGGKVRVLPLDSVTDALVAQQATYFVTATDEKSASDLNLVVEWAWEAIVGPVLDHLAELASEQTTEPDHIWWCPTGMATFLPLHVAHARDAHAGNSSALDRIVSSYTPTLMALAQRPIHQPTATALLVAVSNPHYPRNDGGQWGALDLGEDTANFTQQFPTANVLTAESATRAAVADALQQADLVHLACHASGDVDAPSDSHLALYDGPLTANQLSAGLHKLRTLAFLAACESFRGGTAIPDENITLANALQATGFQHVVATQWQAADDIATMICREFYQRATNGTAELVPAQVGAALAAAMRYVRDTTGAPTLWWGPYVHIGP